MATIKGLNIKIGADATDFNRSLNEINRNTRGLNKELSSINRELKFDTKNPELLAQKTKILADRFDETSKKLDLLKEAQIKVKKAFDEGKIDEREYEKLQTEIMTTETKLKGLEKQYVESQKEMLRYDGVLGKLTTRLEDTGAKMQEYGKKLTVYSAGAAGALLGIGKAAMDFDTAWVGVQKTMSDDITPQQLAEIKDGIKLMSKEIGVGTTEIASIAESAGQLGIETESILGFTRTMVDMGKSTNLSSDLAATTLARFANVTKMSQGDFDRLGSTIVSLGNNFATTEAEIAAMSMNLGSAGTQIGMSHSDIVALATALSSVGLEAAGGGTAMSKFMVEMELAAKTGLDAYGPVKKLIEGTSVSFEALSKSVGSNSKEYKAMASEIGISTTEINKMFKSAATAEDSLEQLAKVTGTTREEFANLFESNPTGALELFIQSLAETNMTGESAIVVLDEMGIKETRLRDALLRSANASDVFTNAIKMGSNAWEENTALQDEAQQRYESVEGKWNKMKESANVLAINLGDKLLPYVTDFFDGATKLVNKFDDMDDGTKKFIVTATGLLAIGAPILILGGKVISGLGAITGALGSTAKFLGIIKPASGLAASALGTVGSASAATAASATAGGGALAGFGTALGSAAVAAAPYIAAGALVVGTGYAVYKGLTKEAIPAVDLFAEHIDYTSATMDEFGNIVGETTTVISEKTQENVNSYLEMSENLQQENLRMFSGLVEGSTENLEHLKQLNTEAVDFVIEEGERNHAETISQYNEIFADSTSITQEQKDLILEYTEAEHSNRKALLQTQKVELGNIYDQIAKQGGEATESQKNRINEIQEEQRKLSIQVLSETEAEAAVINNRMKSYGERMSAEQAANVVKEYNTMRDEAIAASEQQRDATVKLAEEMRAKNPEKFSEMADEMISEANRMNEETVKETEKLRINGLQKLETEYTNLYKDVNLTTGEIATFWDKATSVNKDWNKLKFDNKSMKVTTNYHDVYSSEGKRGSEKLHNNGLLNVPYDGYRAILHRDERVLTAYENRQLKRDGYLGNSRLADKDEIINNVDNSTTVNNINLTGTYHVREENDMKRIAQELHKLSLRKGRA